MQQRYFTSLFCRICAGTAAGQTSGIFTCPLLVKFSETWDDHVSLIYADGVADTDFQILHNLCWQACPADCRLSSSTGSNTAMGFIKPVRDALHSISSNFVSFIIAI